MVVQFLFFFVIFFRHVLENTLEKIMRSREQCNTASAEAEKKIREKVVFKISAARLRVPW